MAPTQTPSPSLPAHDGRPTKRQHARNNLDLIRLCAAIQVAVTHLSHHLHLDFAVVRYLDYFPGVPIFFFISGYLIYQSYENIRHDRLRTFFTNRFLRIYPALYVCFGLTVLSIVGCGYLKTVSYSATSLLAWVAASLSFFQFYTPDFLRGYATGVPNGSLWTISVELQFYFLTPVLHFALKRFRRTAAALFILLVLVNTANLYANVTDAFPGIRDRMAFKLFGASFLPWLYMFAFGAYVSTNKSLQAHILKLNPLVFAAAYLGSYYLAEKYNLGTVNYINLVSYLLLAALVFRLAYWKPETSGRLLRGNDISYGFYIYHMPLVNLMVFYGFIGTLASFWTALAGTLALACGSWFLIEKPFLKLKKTSLRTYAEVK
jgi:peptidoglycan/LPS O-acetylase OafA/YrhL